MMYQSIRIICLVIAAGLSAPGSANAAECVKAGLTPFSALARQIKSEPVPEPRDLVSARLMQARDRARCRLAYRLVWLRVDGRLVSVYFDARSLRQINAPPDLVWQDYRPEDNRKNVTLPGGTRSVIWTEVQ